VDAFAGTLARFARAPLATALNVIVIGIALALPAGLYLVLVNVQALARGLATDPQLTVFLALEAGAADVQRLEKRLRQHPAVRAVRFISREQALQELKASTGLADVVDSLPANPLPDAFVIEPRETAAQALESLREEVSRWPGVSYVQLDTVWVQRLEAGLKLARLALALLAALFAVALIAIAFNTIRLQILTRREEIEVAKLIGASDAFIRRPFLYFGALQGLAGGIAAWSILWGAVALLNTALAELSRLYATPLALALLEPEDSLSLLLFSTTLGWVGAWLSVNQHLARLPPR
jgi:cell division transport system permease protein